MVTCVGEYAGMVTVKMTIHGKDFKILNMWTSFNYTVSNIHRHINICQKTCDQNGLQELDVHPRKESDNATHARLETEKNLFYRLGSNPGKRGE